MVYTEHFSPTGRFNWKVRTLDKEFHLVPQMHTSVKRFLTHEKTDFFSVLLWIMQTPLAWGWTGDEILVVPKDIFSLNHCMLFIAMADDSFF